MHVRQRRRSWLKLHTGVATWRVVPLMHCQSGPIKETFGLIYQTGRFLWCHGRTSVLWVWVVWWVVGGGSAGAISIGINTRCLGRGKTGGRVREQKLQVNQPLLDFPVESQDCGAMRYNSTKKWLSNSVHGCSWLKGTHGSNARLGNGDTFSGLYFYKKNSQAELIYCE